MELIKQLDEMAKTDMDDETEFRLVRFAKQDIEEQGAQSDDEKLEIIHSMIENIAGFEETADAVQLANRVLNQVNRLLD